jgi:ABC-type nitrate/sulfonate/bicarbonate transport system, ATPase component
MEITVKIKSYNHIKKKENFFDSIDFNITSTGIYFLIGSSGIGKTTLLNIILGLSEGNFEGNVKFKKDNAEYSPINVRRQGLIGYMSQDSTLIPWIDVKENLVLPAKVNKNLSNPSEEEIINILKSLHFEENEISGLLKMYSDELSFGMKARIGLARVLLYKPSFLILDELFTGTDSYTNECIGNYLKSKENEMLIFSVSHNVERAFKIAQKIFVLNIQEKKRCLTSFEKVNFETNKQNIINLLKN